MRHSLECGSRVVTKAWLKLANTHNNRAFLNMEEKKDGKKKQTTSLNTRNSMPLSECTEAAVRREEDGCESYGHGDVASPGTCQVFVDVFVHECVLQKSEN